MVEDRFYYEEWKRFDIVQPKPDQGVIIKITNDTRDWGVMSDKLFYGYMRDYGYIFLIYEITANAPMAWKVLKEYDLKDLYWFYVYEFASQEILDAYNELKK